jgi:CubicO group peptidase (beta-lactamase class C family)
MMNRICSIGWWLVLVWVHLAAQQATRLPTATIEKVERAITSEMARQNIPGMSAAIVTDHQLRWSNGFGFSDLENFVPAKASTVYRLGSISKPITAVAVLQLVEQGKLDLDAPVQRYVPSFPQKPWPVTPRHLLSHTSGIRHYRGDEINITKQYQSLTEGLTIFQSDSLLFQPGTRYSYSTYGYNLLGVVVEGASGKAFVDYTREQIFTPAGMIHARDDNVYDIIYNRAYGYRKTSTGELKNSELANTSYKIPGGGFVSTVEDLAKFAIAVQTNKLLKAETTQRMFTPQKLANGQILRVNPNNPNNPNVSYGLGWFLNEHNGEREVYHSGAQQRVSTLLYMLPDKKFAVVLMSNLEGAGLLNLAREIADIVLKGK